MSLLSIHLGSELCSLLLANISHTFIIDVLFPPGSPTLSPYQTFFPPKSARLHEKDKTQPSRTIETKESSNDKGMEAKERKIKRKMLVALR